MNRPTNVPNPQELNSILKKVVDLARLKAKSTDTFIVYDLDGKLIREYPDGKKYELVRDEHGLQKEVPYVG